MLVDLCILAQRDTLEGSVEFCGVFQILKHLFGKEVSGVGVRRLNVNKPKRLHLQEINLWKICLKKTSNSFNILFQLFFGSLENNFICIFAHNLNNNKKTKVNGLSM